MLGLIVGPQNDTWKKIPDWLKQLDIASIHTTACVAGRKEIEQNPQIDLVIVDADFADESGLKLIAVMKNDSRLARIPIIVAGEHIDEDMAVKYGQLGVDNIVVFPTDKVTLEAKIRKAVMVGKPRILVVDDEESIRELLSDFLMLERYAPVLASNVDEAMNIVRSQKVDAIITDIMMPGKSGLDLLVEVKQDHPYIPVIMITGLSQRYTPKDVIAMGADGYFAKPFHNLELIYTLRKALLKRARHALSGGEAAETALKTSA